MTPEGGPTGAAKTSLERPTRWTKDPDIVEYFHDNPDILIKALEAHLMRGGGIGLGPVSLREDDIRGLIAGLSHPDIHKRLDKFQKRPEITDPFLHLLATQLGLRCDVADKHTHQVATNLLRHLAGKPYDSSEIQKSEVSKNILTEDLLDETMAAAKYRGIEGSVIEQLESPLFLAEVGLVINPKDRSNEFGVTLPRKLLEILDTLRHKESLIVLETWIYNNITENTAGSISLLKALASFSTFLDSETLVQLYEERESGQIPLLPFHSLHAGIRRARITLEEARGYEHIVEELRVIEDSVLMRFHQLIYGPLEGTISARAREQLTPQIDTLAYIYINSVANLRMINGITFEEAANAGIKLFEQVGGDNPEAFLAVLSEWEDAILPDEWGKRTLVDTIRRRFIEENRIIDLEGSTIRETRNHTLQLLEEIPWVDASEIDFADVIDQNTDTVEVYLITGTFGPFCPGHQDLIERLLRYFDHKETLESDGRKVQRMILIAPFTDIGDIPQYGKDLAVVGNLYERVGSTLIQLAGTSRDRVLITTSLQPSPSEVGNTAERINVTANRFQRKIVTDLEQRQLSVTQNVRLLRAFGIDEFRWQTQKGVPHLDTNTPQPRKVREGCVAVGRYGYLLGSIMSAPLFEEYTAVEDIILTPGTPRTSSTEAVAMLAAGSSSMFPVSVVPFVEKYWKPEAIRKRRGAHNKHVESVSEIYTKMVREYRELLEASGELVT